MTEDLVRAMSSNMTLAFFQVFAAALLLDVTVADTVSAGRIWDVGEYRSLRAQPNRTTQGALGKPHQSLKPTPGEIRGLGSRFPDIGVAPGTPGGPKYYPKAMRPIEPQ